MRAVRRRVLVPAEMRVPSRKALCGPRGGDSMTKPPSIFLPAYPGSVEHVGASSLAESFESWKTAWKRRCRFSGMASGTRSTLRCCGTRTLRGEIDWAVSVDSTVNRAHQHATNLPRVTGGSTEQQQSARGAASSRGRPVTRRFDVQDPSPGRRSRVAHGRDRRSGTGRRRTDGPGAAGTFVRRESRNRTAADSPGSVPRRQGVLLRGDAGIAPPTPRRGRDSTAPDQIGHRLRRGSRGGQPPGSTARTTAAATSSSAPSATLSKKVARHRHPLGQAVRRLPRWRRPQRHLPMAQTVRRHTLGA